MSKVTTTAPAGMSWKGVVTSGFLAIAAALQEGLHEVAAAIREGQKEGHG